MKFREDKNIILCSLEGTLQEISHYHNIANTEDICRYSPLNMQLMHIIDDFIVNGYQFVLAVDRPEYLEDATLEWCNNNKVYYDYLFMNYKNLEEVDFKQDIISKIPHIYLAIDKSINVCQMYDKYGIFNWNYDYNNKLKPYLTKEEENYLLNN